jgi:hypothetical protein
MCFYRCLSACRSRIVLFVLVWLLDVCSYTDSKNISVLSTSSSLSVPLHLHNIRLDARDILGLRKVYLYNTKLC